MERYPVDGNIDFSSLPGVSERTVRMYALPAVTPSHAVTVRWAMTNDDREIYLAVEWTDNDNDALWDLDGPITYDSICLLVDNDGDGAYEDGEDKKAIFAALQGAHYIDTKNGPGEVPQDVIGDGKGFVKYHADRGLYQAEFILPLASDARGDDAALTAATRFNFVLFDRIQSATGEGHAGLLFGGLDMADSREWEKLALTPADRQELPGIPPDLEGTIVFISKHETARGGIYVFNPGTGAVHRVRSAAPSDLDTLHIDGISLSRDRGRVAFTGWTDTGGITSADVYIMNLDGSGFRNITAAPATLEGHPAWSPDGSKLLFIQYAGGPSHIFVAPADGSTPPMNITASFAGYEHNDPEWLPDGRVLFKTSYWNPWAQYPNELRVAVMNADGSGLTQVSSGIEVVDHDPISDGTWAVWERLNGPWDYAQDIRSYFTPWDILEARLDGSGQHVIVGDRWVNWLPVYDPSGRYVAYLKSCGYTEARLITRDGRDLGRLIPGITMIHYLDWK